ncbi:hypothetical protein [Aeromonas veronii]|uniref:hypothetical protein n=1 Tax=Aeromonas veronii TaxID=654 RepID=UPI0024438A04|nr:hypothetical protein [Aeromonas veronii]
MRSFVVLLLGLLALPLWAAPTVVSTVPVLHAINLSLLADTDIVARYLPPRQIAAEPDPRLAEQGGCGHPGTGRCPADDGVVAAGAGDISPVAPAPDPGRAH